MYAPFPHQLRDSYATTDFESVGFKPKQVTGPEFNDRNNVSRKVGLVGVAIVALFGWVCIFEGFMIFLSKSTVSSGIAVVTLKNSWERELLALGLNLVVTACTEVTGFVHAIALRSALADERRLHFNTNLRLLTAASGWFNPNGTLCNVLMAILLIASYSSSLLVTLTIDMDPSNSTDPGFAMGVSEVPLIVLGVTLLLQAIIALASVRAQTKILTWSTSPFDITAALLDNLRILPELGNCMRGVGDDSPSRQGPTTPSKKQSSAWRAHHSVRKVIVTLWVLVVGCIVWGIVIVYLSDHDISRAVQSWSFFPHAQSHVIAYSIPLTDRGAYWYWALYYVDMAAIQGPLTLSLHCSELVVNVIRDERVWRKATTEKGTTISTHPLAPVLGSPLNVGLLLAKPVLHWMLGLAISLAGTAESGYLTAIAVTMWPFQILNYSGALLIFSLVLTIIAFRQPSGPQPSAYGHVQTLANLIDDWSPTMWWGHKSDGYPFKFRHAGTSDSRLGEVYMDTLYA